MRRLAKMTALENPLRALQVFGQSVWLDYIRRSLITSGELRRLIDEDGLRGVTSNPAIFEKAVAGSSDYNEILEAPEARALDAEDALREARRPRHPGRGRCAAPRVRGDGEARRIRQPGGLAAPRARHGGDAWTKPGDCGARSAAHNLMIKVPATPQGIPAIEQLISEGINVNVTLLFAQDAYEQVADAYHRGTGDMVAARRRPRARGERGQFLHQPDRHRDRWRSIAARLQATAETQESKACCAASRGKVAIANAKLTYQRYQELFSGPRWQALAGQGAQTQRLLWASTGTKNPNYRDVIYVEELIGPDTVEHDSSARPSTRFAITGGRARASPKTSTPPATRWPRSPRPASR